MEQSTIAIIIISLAMISFALERIPLVATAMLASLAMAIFGIIPPSEAYAGFSSNVAMMVVGMMIVGNSLFETGVASKLGDVLSKTKVVNNERVFIMVVTLIAGALSAFTSNSAVIALMIPIIASIASRPGSKITQKNVLLPVGMAAVIGGGITMSGSTPQVVAQTALEQLGLRQMGYFDLAWVGVPRLLLVVIYFGTIGYTLEKKVLTFDDVIDKSVIESNDKIVAYEGGGDQVEAGVIESSDKVVSKTKMWISSLTMIGVIAGFISETFSLGFWSLLGATILIATKCITPKQAFASVDWNTIGILGAAQGFAAGLNNSGAGTLIAESTINLFGGAEIASPLFITIAIIIVTAVLTNVLSDTALATMFTPIAANIAYTLGVDPLAMVIGVVLATGGDFTPIATAGLTQTLVGGYRFMDYVKILAPLWFLLMITTVVLCPIMYPF